MTKANPANFDYNKYDADLTIETMTTQLLTPNSYASNAKGKKGLSRIVKAAGYSIDGFKAAYKLEAAFRQVFWLNILLFMAIIYIPFGLSIKMLLIIASFLTLIAELFNTGMRDILHEEGLAKRCFAPTQDVA